MAALNLIKVQIHHTAGCPINSVREREKARAEAVENVQRKVEKHGNTFFHLTANTHMGGYAFIYNCMYVASERYAIHAIATVRKLLYFDDVLVFMYIFVPTLLPPRTPN